MHGKLKVVKAYTEDHLIAVTVATLFLLPYHWRRSRSLVGQGWARLTMLFWFHRYAQLLLQAQRAGLGT